MTSQFIDDNNKKVFTLKQFIQSKHKIY